MSDNGGPEQCHINQIYKSQNKDYTKIANTDCVIRGISELRRLAQKEYKIGYA